MPRPVAYKNRMCASFKMLTKSAVMPISMCQVVPIVGVSCLETLWVGINQPHGRSELGLTLEDYKMLIGIAQGQCFKYRKSKEDTCARHVPDWPRHGQPSDVDGVKVGAVEVRRRPWSLRLCDLTVGGVVGCHYGHVTCRETHNLFITHSTSLWFTLQEGDSSITALILAICLHFLCVH